jgi:hypothetical protein
VTAFSGSITGGRGREPVLVFHEVLTAAGSRSGRCDRLAGQPIRSTFVPVRAVVGTVGRPGQFDQRFQPLTEPARLRLGRLAEHVAHGGSVPPVRLLRIGGLYFVLDGHHRVALARASGQHAISASVQPVCTVAAVEFGLQREQLPLKAAERDFLRAVPLPDAATTQIQLPRPGDYRALAGRARQWCRSHGFDHGAEGTPLSPAAAAAWWRLAVRPDARRRPATPAALSAAAYLAQPHD